MLKLYNTLTRKKEIFKSILDKKVGLYTCGPTVYLYQHIGNLRSYVFSDILKRVLLFNGYNVRHVVNVTDVGHLTSDADVGEDKMEKAAQKEGKTAKEIAHFYFSVFKNDLEKLNILQPDLWPKATEHIKEQMGIIKILEKKGFTYETEDGIYFDTSKLKDYGKLARLNIKGLKEGARVDVRGKKNKTDFALWKFSPGDEKRQQEWGFKGKMGFPGWHIECSAMSMKYLGKHFDIHTGGEDHIAVHHTNEIAQSEAATGNKFVNYWLHGAFLTFKGEKVSKSKGGLYTLEELEKNGFEDLSYRYLCLLTHYRKPLEFSLDALASAQNAYRHLSERIKELQSSKEDNGNTQKFEKEFLAAINDDLNMPRAIAVVWDLLKDGGVGGKKKHAALIKFDNVLGLGLKEMKKEVIPDDIVKLAEARLTARKGRDWKMADIIRARIKEKGYLIEDSDDGFRVRKV